MLRTHTCGQLRKKDTGQEVTLCGWVKKGRDLGGMTFIDLRDRYGITQLVFDMEANAVLCKKARQLGREYVLQVCGKVAERSNKNPDLPTGDIEILVESLEVLNKSKTPPFTIEDETDGGETLRLQYRYLDLRREVLQRNIQLRHRVLQETRKYMDAQGFLEIETPFLIKSTPEGARDFVVPSRMHPGAFYALPQSPQTFKQLLMVGGFDKYFQIVRCFRDEDLRADRQPEFTQIDCEMTFVEQEDVLQAFEGLVHHLFEAVLDVKLPKFKRLTHAEAMALYGTDKPDLRFDMAITELTGKVQGKDFKIFDQAETVAGIAAPGAASYSRKQIDKLTDFATSQQVGAKGLIWVKYGEDGAFKSSVDKFFGPEDLKAWANAMDAKPGDLLLLIAGDRKHTLRALGELRLHVAGQLKLRDDRKFVPLFVVDFPLFEWNEEEKRWDPSHHPFTSPRPEDLGKLEKSPGEVRANAYDMVINGVEVAGGSVRIHDRPTQERVFKAIGLTDEEARQKFGFLMDAFEYGAPPHGGIAFGFDRLVALLGGGASIRPYIAFPKNNAGRDLMLKAPDTIDAAQLKELGLQVVDEGPGD